MVSAPIHIDGNDGMSTNNSSADVKQSQSPVPAQSMKRVPSEAKSLESESKDLLGRVGIAGAARRCAEYKPTLDELEETTFSDYIRGEVLGVPLPGYEFLYIHEDNKGRETKREIPLGQVPPPNYGEPIDSPVPVYSGQRNSSTPKQPDTDATLDDTASKKMRTRSQSKNTQAKAVPPKASVNEPKKYQMCRYKLRDGMAKVSLPAGFWAKIDSSARGRHVSTSVQFG